MVLAKALLGSRHALERRAAELVETNRTLQAEIAERRGTMDELRESEERFSQVTENMREVFFLVDPWNTRTFYVSTAYEEIWGRSCESLYDVEHEVDQPQDPAL
jgi:PAS domain-containing protein